MDAQKLAKVLAMAASDNEIEALHALRTARRLLEADGADFVELGRRIAGSSPAAPGTAQAHVEDLEDAIFDLRNEIRHVRSENERLRQGRPATGEPATLSEAAKEAAAAIRLRAELDQVQAEMLSLQTREAMVGAQLHKESAEAARLAARVAELDSRRMRLEAENRRLATTNNALMAELSEAREISGRLAAQLVAMEVKDKLTAKQPKRGKAQGANQYALL